MRGELAKVTQLKRDRGANGWIIDYKTLERITAKACQIEPVSMEETEAVMLAMIDEYFARLEDD